MILPICTYQPPTRKKYAIPNLKSIFNSSHFVCFRQYAHTIPFPVHILLTQQHLAAGIYSRSHIRSARIYSHNHIYPPASTHTATSIRRHLLTQPHLSARIYSYSHIYLFFFHRRNNQSILFTQEIYHKQNTTYMYDKFNHQKNTIWTYPIVPPSPFYSHTRSCVPLLLPNDVDSKGGHMCTWRVTNTLW